MDISNLKINTATLVERKILNPVGSVLHLTFNLEHALPQPFHAGQFITIKINENTYRAYSIASSPHSLDQFNIILTIDKPGMGANYLNDLKVGDTIQFMGPRGRFKLNKDFAPTLNFIATGTGISPFISMFHVLKDPAQARTPTTLDQPQTNPNVNFYWGVRKVEDVYLDSMLDQFKQTIPNFNYWITLSQEQTHNFLNGRVTNHLDDITFSNAHNYICGHPGMVEDVLKHLMNYQIPPETIFFEKFTVGAPQSLHLRTDKP